MQTLNLSAWEMRISKRGIAFFKFVANWSRYVANFLVHQVPTWQDIPGYSTIINAVLNEMKSIPVSSYSDALKDATLALITNENILTVFINITFSKTRYL